MAKPKRVRTNVTIKLSTVDALRAIAEVYEDSFAGVAARILDGVCDSAQLYSSMFPKMEYVVDTRPEEELTIKETRERLKELDHPDDSNYRVIGMGRISGNAKAVMKRIADENPDYLIGHVNEKSVVIMQGDWDGRPGNTYRKSVNVSATGKSVIEHMKQHREGVHGSSDLIDTKEKLTGYYDHPSNKSTPTIDRSQPAYVEKSEDMYGDEIDVCWVFQVELPTQLTYAPIDDGKGYWLIGPNDWAFPVYNSNEVRGAIQAWLDTQSE